MRQHSGIGVLDKAVQVLTAIGDSPCGLAELCERTGLPRATAHRLAAGLEVHRLLSRDGDGQWQLGAGLTELAAHVNDPLLSASAQVLPKLREITGESVQLYRREGTVRICVAALEPPAGLRDTVPVGSRLPMSAGSGAKVLLAHSDPGTQAAVLPGATFTERALADVRKRGWAQSAAEREPGSPAFRHLFAIGTAMSLRQYRFPAPSTGWADGPGHAGPPISLPPPRR